PVSRRATIVECSNRSLPRSDAPQSDRGRTRRTRFARPQWEPSVPVPDLDVVRTWPTFPGLAQRLQAHQESRPLGAAVIHELDGLLPSLVLEEHDREIPRLLEIETNPRTDPLDRPVDNLPYDAIVGFELENLHVEDTELLAVVREAEPEAAAHMLIAGRLFGPPPREACGRRERLVHFVDGCLDTHSMQDIEHDASP